MKQKTEWLPIDGAPFEKYWVYKTGRVGFNYRSDLKWVNFTGKEISTLDELGDKGKILGDL